MKEFFYKYSDRDDLIAIRTTSEKFSYKEIFSSAKILSSKLPVSNSARNKFIPILFSNSIEFIKLILALWNKGLTPVPINTRWTEKEIESIVIKHNFDLIFYEHEFSDKVKNLSIQKFSFDEIFSFQSSEVERISNDEALVIFTSGSSGEPKGVLHTFNSLANSIVNGESILNQNISNRWLASLPFYHIGGFQIFCRALSNGCEIIIPENLETDSLQFATENFHPTHISLVSTQLQRLLDSNTKVSNSLKVTLIGGGFSEDDLLVRANEKGWKPIRVYGSSETASFITAATVDEIKLKPLTVGKPVKNVSINISEEDEVLISSNSLFKQYLNNPEETKLKLKNGVYHSADSGRIEDEYLFIEARRNDLIITGGENVNPYEVEKALLKIDDIKEACVFAMEDELWGQKVCAAIVTSKKLNEKTIKDLLGKELASFKIPKEIFFIDEFPKTSLGKIEREKVKFLFSSKK